MYYLNTTKASTAQCTCFEPVAWFAFSAFNIFYRRWFYCCCWYGVIACTHCFQLAYVIFTHIHCGINLCNILCSWAIRWNATYGICMRYLNFIHEALEREDKTCRPVFGVAQTYTIFIIFIHSIFHIGVSLFCFECGVAHFVAMVQYIDSKR